MTNHLNDVWAGFNKYRFLNLTWSLLKHNLQAAWTKGILKTLPKWSRGAFRFRSASMLPIYICRLTSHWFKQQAFIAPAFVPGRGISETKMKRVWSWFLRGWQNKWPKLFTIPQTWPKGSHLCSRSSLLKNIWAPQHPIIACLDQPNQMPSFLKINEFGCTGS